MAELVIRNEADLYYAIEIEAQDRLKDFDSFRFEGYPRFELIVRGESFDGGVPTRVMPAFIELQKIIHRHYAEFKYGDRAKRLSHDDKQITEIIVKLEDGHSTLFEVDLQKVLNSLIENMDSKDKLKALLGIATILAASWLVTEYWSNQLDERKMEHELTLDRADKEHYQKLMLLISKHQGTQNTYHEMSNFYEALGKGLTDSDTIISGDQPVIDGLTARQVMRKPREAPIEARLDGKFHIEAVDTIAVPNGFRLKVRQASSNLQLTLDIPAGTLDEAQTRILQSSEWGKKPASMKINIKKVGNRISKATLIEAGLIE